MEEERYLITSSLLDSWRYLLNNDKSNFEDFLSTLKREPHETTKAQQDGYDFEDWMIKNYQQTLNGQYQVVEYKNYNSKSGMKYLLYGRLDCLKEGTIYDYKHTSKYAVGKFFNRCQTSMYMALVPEATKMVYLVGTDKPKYQIEENQEELKYNLYSETYEREDVTPIENIITEFENWLNSVGLMEVYKKYWRSKK